MATSTTAWCGTFRGSRHATPATLTAGLQPAAARSPAVAGERRPTPTHHQKTGNSIQQQPVPRCATGHTSRAAPHGWADLGHPLAQRPASAFRGPSMALWGVDPVHPLHSSTGWRGRSASISSAPTSFCSSAPGHCSTVSRPTSDGKGAPAQAPQAKTPAQSPAAAEAEAPPAPEEELTTSAATSAAIDEAFEPGRDFADPGEALRIIWQSNSTPHQPDTNAQLWVSARRRAYARCLEPAHFAEVAQHAMFQEDTARLLVERDEVREAPL